MSQLDLLDYEPPRQRHSDTSTAAAEQIRLSVTLLQSVVLEALRQGPANDDELCVRTNLQGNTLRPRRIELLRKHLIKDSGERRKTGSGRKAVVWAVI